MMTLAHRAWGKHIGERDVILLQQDLVAAKYTLGTASQQRRAVGEIIYVNNPAMAPNQFTFRT